MYGRSAFDVDSAYFEEQQDDPRRDRVRQEPGSRQVTKRREIHVTRTHRDDGRGGYDSGAPRGGRDRRDGSGPREQRDRYDGGAARGNEDRYVGGAPRGSPDRYDGVAPRGKVDRYDDGAPRGHSSQDNHFGDMQYADQRNFRYRDERRGNHGHENHDDTDDFRGVNHRGAKKVTIERREVKSRGHSENPRGEAHPNDGRSARYQSDSSRVHYDNGTRSMDRRNNGGDYRNGSRHAMDRHEDMNHVDGRMERGYSSDREFVSSQRIPNGEREVRMRDWDQGQGQRSQERQRSRNGSHSSSVREVSDHLDEIDTLERGPRGKPLPGGKKFFRKVQTELEELREEWKDEVERLTEMSLSKEIPQSAQTQGTNSFVDTSSGRAVFTALVDVSEFHPKSVEVDYDHLTNKVSVKGRNMNGIATMTKTFTQKVQLPRYADDQQLTTRLSPSGILKVEVPLLYYFPEQQNKGRDVKSFVNEVRTNRDGSQTLEILVNTGPGVRAKDLHVQVSEERELLVTANIDDANGRSVKKLLKRYNLPERADVDRIRSKMGRDGRLMVLVPLYKH